MNAILAGWFGLSILCDVTGQLSFKRGTEKHVHEKAHWAAFLASGWVWLGIAIYAVEIVVWVRILSLVPLAVAFPIASLNFIAITLASRIFLGERVTRRRWAGTGLICAGVVLVAQGV